MNPFPARPSRFAASLIPVLLLLSLPAVAGEIHEAIAAGDQARVAVLIAGDPSLASQPDNNRNRDLPLHAAATVGNVEIARMLLDAGADVNGYDVDESTPLDVAAMRRHRELVEFLIARGAGVNHRDRNGACPISFAAFGGDSAIVRTLMNAGADLDYRGRDGNTLMHAAAFRGQIWLMDVLAGRGGDVNAATAAGETPMIWAVRGGRAESVNHLVALGANPALPDTFGRAPLHACVLSNRPDAAQALLAHGVGTDPIDHNGESPLLYAAAMDRPELVEMLLANGADMNLVSETGNTALSWAVQRGSTRAAQALLDAGARADVRDSRSECTPLHAAARHGHQDLVTLLLDHGASPTTRDREGMTAADAAARYSHRAIVDLLVERGAPAPKPAENVGLAAPGTLAAKEMKIWSLGHSGWAIQTASHLLVFDYALMGRPADDPALANGYIRPEEIADQNVVVFVSHEHNDHFDPTIFAWREKIPRLSYVFGFAPERANRPDLPQTLPAHEVMGPRETRTFGGVKVTTIESNDSGVGFLVEADGAAIFHAGDHANRQRDFSGPFKSEIEFLASTGVRPDVAFLPVSGCGFGDQEAVRLGDYHVLETLKPAVFVPMHGGDQGWRYREFIDACGSAFPATQLHPIECRGDCVCFKKGRVS